MAKQAGPILLQTTWDDITFYKMDGIYYARKKSRLTREKVLNHPAFAATRKSANRLALAAQIASAIYKALPTPWRQYWMYRSFTGEASLALKAGHDAHTVYAQLWDTYAACWQPANQKAPGLQLKEPQRPGKRPRLRHRSENPHHRRYQRLLGPNHWKSTYDNTKELEAKARKEAARQRNREWFELTCLQKATPAKNNPHHPHKRAATTRLRRSRRRRAMVRPQPSSTILSGT